MADEQTAANGTSAAEKAAPEMIEAAKYEAALAELGDWKARALEAQGKAVERDKFASDLETMRADLDAAKSAADAAQAALTRAHVGLEHGLSREHIDLFLTGSDEATITAQAKALADMRGPEVRAPRPAPAAALEAAPLALNGDIEGALRRRLNIV